jgi:CheY-like chemotaxis protein
MTMLLRLWGYEARAAYSGAAGLEMARNQRPDCLLLDINMPGGIDGYTLARQVRREPGLEEAKLVALTAYSDPRHTERARKAGFDYHIVKPADPDKVQELLDMMTKVAKLTAQTARVARQNVQLATETKELLQQVKEDLQEVKADVKELKADLTEVREELNQKERGANQGSGPLQ